MFQAKLGVVKSFKSSVKGHKGGPKLFKAYVEAHKVEILVSYCDREVIGGLVPTLGSNLERSSCDVCFSGLMLKYAIFI